MNDDCLCEKCSAARQQTEPNNLEAAVKRNVKVHPFGDVELDSCDICGAYVVDAKGHRFWHDPFGEGADESEALRIADQAWDARVRELQAETARLREELESNDRALASVVRQRDTANEVIERLRILLRSKQDEVERLRQAVRMKQKGEG